MGRSTSTPSVEMIQNLIQLALIDPEGFPKFSQESSKGLQIDTVRTFRQEGTLTGHGLVLTMVDGSKYQMCLARIPIR